MKKRILIACDLEGVNHVVGEPYMGLARDTEQWEVARRQAAREINAAADALFALGAECVALWDNHGGGKNIDAADLDERIALIDVDKQKTRMYFAPDYDCVCYFGYHTMEGTLGGVLAHTMDSKKNQYYKLNGQYIGEIDIDAYIAASYGLPSVFFAGGDLTCAQAKRALPDIVTVVTKQELSRNEAEFRENDELFAEIKEKAVLALESEQEVRSLTFPAVMEKSFKRTEDAAAYFAWKKSLGLRIDYLACDILGHDAHTVVVHLNSMEDFLKCF